MLGEVLQHGGRKYFRDGTVLVEAQSAVKIYAVKLSN